MQCGGFYSRLSGFFGTVRVDARLTEIVLPQPMKLNPPVRHDQVTFLVTGMMSDIAGQLFVVNGEMA